MTADTKKFTKIFDDKENKDINDMGDKFLKELNEISHQCFKKIRVKTESKKDEIDSLLDNRRTLKKSKNKEDKKKLEDIEDDIPF